MAIAIALLIAILAIYSAVTDSPKPPVTSGQPLSRP
jgi:hypothetical protein